MATSYMDFASPSVQFTYDTSRNTTFSKDSRNFFNLLSIHQLNTLGNTSLLDVFMTTGNVVEPHYHQNATELVYGVSGTADISIINPFTNELLAFKLSPRIVVNIPQGWWHYIVATAPDTHFLAIFDAPEPQVILGSDILRLTPPSVLAHTYCLNEASVKEAFAPLQSTVGIGPPASCYRQMGYANADAGAITAATPQMSAAISGYIGSSSISGSNELGHSHRPHSFNPEYSETPFHPIPFLYRNWD